MAIAGSESPLFKRVLCSFIIIPFLAAGLPFSRFLQKWIQKWYYFIVRPLPYILSSQFEKWFVFQLGPSVLAIIASGVIFLLLGFKITGLIVVLKEGEKFANIPRNLSKPPTVAIPPSIAPVGFQSAKIQGPYSQVSIRREPWDLSTVQGTINKEQYVYIQDFGGPWIKMQTINNEIEGYLSRKQLLIQSPKNFPDEMENGFKKAFANLNDQFVEIKESPLDRSRSICQFRKDEAVYVRDFDDQWYKCFRPKDGQTGYVKKGWVELKW